MSGSEASYHDDDDDGAGVRGGESVNDADVNVDVGADADADADAEADADADADAAAAAHEEELAHSLKKMGKIVNNLIARADSVPFREPVDWKGLQLYDYPKIITRMMDLGTVKSRLRKSKYAQASECADDVRQIWTNCMTYNDDGSDFYRLAHSYSRRFEERYQKLVDEFGEDVMCGRSGGGNDDDDAEDVDDATGYNDGGGATRQPKAGGRKSRSNSITSSNATGRNTPLLPAAAPTSAAAAANSEKGGHGGRGGGGGAGSASKADRPGNYDSTSDIVPLDVRTRFAARLQRLSGMELGHVLQVIDLQCPEALEDPAPESLTSDAPPLIHGHRYAWDEFDGGCQVEVDVDSIPPDTFWELDRYVKEKVHGRGRGAWSDDITEAEPGGGSKKRKMKSI